MVVRKPDTCGNPTMLENMDGHVDLLLLGFYDAQTIKLWFRLGIPSTNCEAFHFRFGDYIRLHQITPIRGETFLNEWPSWQLFQV